MLDGSDVRSYMIIPSLSIRPTYCQPNERRNNMLVTKDLIEFENQPLEFKTSRKVPINLEESRENTSN